MAKKWKFNSWKDRAVITGSSAASLAAMGAGLSLVFNPLALAVAGGIVAKDLVAHRLLAIPAFRKWQFDGQVKKGKWGVVPSDAPMVRITAEISRQLGRKAPPKIYIVGEKDVAKMTLPFGARWIFRVLPAEMKNKAMQGVFAALPGANTMITTKEALNGNLTESELRFIAAHEMSHLKKDANTPALVARQAVKKATRVLFWGTLIAAGVGMAGVTLPFGGVLLAGGIVGAAKGMGVLMGTYVAGRALSSFGLRAVEKRADRNGIYLTRDIEAADSAFRKIDESAKKPKANYLKECFFDHPFYHRRMKTLRKAFKKVAQYPEVPVPAAKPQPASKPSTP